MLCQGTVKETAIEDDRWDQTWEEASFGVDYLSMFATADGLDLDGERIIEKGSLQQVETRAVVLVGRFHAEKERSHTPTSHQVQTNQTRIPSDTPV